MLNVPLPISIPNEPRKFGYEEASLRDVSPTLAQRTMAPFRMQMLSGWNESLGLVEIAPQDGGIAFRLGMTPDPFRIAVEGDVNYRDRIGRMDIDIAPLTGRRVFDDFPLRLHFDIAYEEVLLSRRVTYIHTSKTPLFHQIQRVVEALSELLRTDPSNEAQIQRVLTSEGARLVRKIFDLVLVLSMDRLDRNHRQRTRSKLRKRNNNKSLIRITHLEILKASAYSEWAIASAQAV